MDQQLKNKIYGAILIVLVAILALVAGISNSRYKKMKSEIDTYESKIVSLKSTNDEYEDLIHSYKKSSIEQNKTISELNEKIESLEDTNIKQSTEIKNLKNKVNSLDEENKDLNSLLIKLQKENKDYSDKILVLTNKYDFAQGQVIELTKQKDTASKKVVDLTDQLEVLKKNISTLTASNKEKEIVIKELNELVERYENSHLVGNELQLLNALSVGGNIVLTSNIMMTSDTVVENKYISLDLNGYNLVIPKIELVASELTVSDSSKTHTGTLKTVGNNENNNYGLIVKDSSTLKLINGNFVGTGIIQVFEGASLYVDGGTYNSNSTDLGTESIQVNADANAYIRGGSFIGNNSAIRNDGNLEIDGAKFDNALVYNISGYVKLINYVGNDVDKILNQVKWVGGNINLSNLDQELYIEVKSDGRVLSDLILPTGYNVYQEDGVTVASEVLLNSILIVK